MKTSSSLLAVAALCLAGAVQAADAEHGKVLSDTCKGCHNAGGIRNPPPTIYHVPLVYGQFEQYIVQALSAYQSGQRKHPGMQALATPLGDQDKQDIAAYWSGLPWGSTQGRLPGDPAAGKDKAAACGACHGADGNGVDPNPFNAPMLAGQYGDYLYHALKAYKSGARSNGLMVGQVAALSDRDMADLASYFATQSHK
jgi:cytochrome c553